MNTNNNKIHKICIMCNTPFTVYPSHKHRKCCSYSCGISARTITRKNRPLPERYPSLSNEDLILVNSLIKEGIDEKLAVGRVHGARNRKQNNHTYKKAMRNNHLLHEYNITTQQYDQMLANQNYVCLICQKPETKMFRGKILRLAVDHDHSTGKIRGLLCKTCNYAVAWKETVDKYLYKTEIETYLGIYNAQSNTERSSRTNQGSCRFYT